MSQALRVLVCGDVNGKYTQLYQRIATIQKKNGSFDILFCIGDFFADDDQNEEWEQLVSGAIKVPISTFVLGPNKKEHVRYFKDLKDGELCPNVTYLGRKGVYTTSSGLTVAYLSGIEKSSGDDDIRCFTEEDVDQLCYPLIGDSKFKGVDILLTSQWPQGVDKYASAVSGVDTKSTGSMLISQLALRLKPRYHFCAREGISYERQPYRNHQVLREGAKHVTRFIALANVGDHKRKYLYAFNLVPLRNMDNAELVKQPTDVTECPYNKSDIFKSSKKNEDSKSQFFYDAKVIERGTTVEPRGGKRRYDNQGGPREKRPPPQPTGPCWFCLGSPEVEKHLVVSVGTHCYLALAKGGLTPDHVLIIPIEHHQSSVTAPPGVVEEIEQYKAALQKCFAKSGKAVISFERNYKSQHLQIQVVPVSASGVDVKDAFMDCAQMQNIELHDIPKHSDIKQIVPAGAPYFYVELPGGDKLLYRISKGFPLQFGREALAHALVLNMPERIDWKACQISKPEETELAAKFRTMFKSFDFTLE